MRDKFLFFLAPLPSIDATVEDQVRYLLGTTSSMLFYTFLDILRCRFKTYFLLFVCYIYSLGPINTRTGNYSAKYLFYRYDDVVAMILLVTGLKIFRLECAKINRVESDNYPQKTMNKTSLIIQIKYYEIILFFNHIC